MFERYRPLLRLIQRIVLPWGLLVPAFVLSLVETGAALWIPMLTKDMVEGTQTGNLPMGVLSFLVAVLVVQAVVSGFSLYCLASAGQHLTASLRNLLFGRLLRLPLGFHDRSESGKLVSRTVSDTTTVQSLLTDNAISFVMGIVSMIGAIVILCLLDWKLTVVLFSTVVVSLLLVLPVTALLMGVGRDVQEALAKFSGRLAEILGDIRLVKASVAEQEESRRANDSILSLRSLGLKEAKIYALLGPAVSLAMTGALVIILGYGGTRVASGELSVGILIAFIMYLFQIVVPMIQLSTFFAQLNKAAGAAENLSELLDEPEEDLVESGRPIPASESIRFENVCFEYEAGCPILDKVDLEIPIGKVTALVGPSGSGKTTVLGLVERFYLPQSGRITYGGTPIGEFGLEPWRRRIGYVAQEAPLLGGTIRDNLCFGLTDSPDDKRVMIALTAARADEFVAKLEHGLETEVGERGVKLSGGQRQRIAIARAFLVDPEILMLDEATANLDSGSEEAVRAALAELMQGRTVVVVAHRFSTIVGADQIVVVESGRITGRGTHIELLASHSLYRKLVEQQSVVATP